MADSTQQVVTTQVDSAGTTTTMSTPYVAGPFDKYGGRKFMLTLFIFIMTWVALGLGWIDKAVFQYVCYIIIFVYVGGNVAQKVGLSISDNFGNKSSNNTPNPPTLP